VEQTTHRALEAGGLYYLRQNNSPQALLYFKQIALHSGIAPIKIFAHLGRVYAKLKLIDEAKKVFEIYVDRARHIPRNTLIFIIPQMD